MKTHHPMFAAMLMALCVPAHAQDSAAPAATEPASNPSPIPKKLGMLRPLRRFLTSFHPFAHKAPPPRAWALQRIGTIRTVSNDGSYVIVELEPGVLVSAGTELLVTASGAGPARLKAAEIEPPYFVADIENGNPKPGDLVQR